MKKPFAVAATLLLALFTAAAFAQSARSAQSAPATLRIGLWTLWHDKEIAVSPVANGVVTLRACAESNSCTSAPLKKQLEIRASSNRVAVAADSHAESVGLTGPVSLTAHGESLTLQNPIRISARNGILVLAVTLPVETYVERVVASESGPADTPESLKALAIVVRSFALHQPHGHAAFDLCDSTHCQLLHWGAMPVATDKPGAPSFPPHLAEKVGGHAAHLATLTTSGESLWFHGQRAEAWFNQNCGGRTATPREVWFATAQGRARSNRPMPWLASRTDPYCIANGTREWSSSLSLSDLTAVLASAGLARPGWKTLTVARRSESGRAVTLLIGSHEITAEDFRLAVGRTIGWNTILSNWYEVSQQSSAEGSQFLFHGRGSGHGVGLCQAGAAAMGAQARDSNQILAQYFPGAIAADEATGLSWQSLSQQGFTLQTLHQTDAAYLPQLMQVLAEAESRSGLQPAGGIVVRAFPSTPAFRDATLAPGWVAAFTEGNWIGTQPLSTLAARKLLVPVLRHEFLHALVESQAAPGTPLWLREGLVEIWGGDAHAAGTTPVLNLDAVDHALAHAATEAQSQAAHRAAAWYAQRLLDYYGRDQVLAWLRSGVPAGVVASIK